MNNGSDTLDLDQLQLPPTSSPSDRRSRRNGLQFVKVPLTWMYRLDEACHLSTYKVAVHLLLQSWKSGDRSVVVTNVMTKQFGVPPRSKSRALRELEQLGLIRVERRPRKSPEAVLLLVEDHKPVADGA